MFNQKPTLKIHGKLRTIEKPWIMGILNITPDSFYDGGKFLDASSALKKAESLINAGVDIIDIGGMSSKPGSVLLAPEDEQARILSTIENLHKAFPEIILSIDTVHSSTAREAVALGAGMINDISAGAIDPKMFATIAELQVPYVLMHMKGLPENMQNAPKYEDPVQEVIAFLQTRISKLKALGVHDILVDPGFGFGKTIAHNYEILSRLTALEILAKPILIGLSRKSMIYKLLNIHPNEALNGSTALHMIALQKGAKILRVHDVKEAVECRELYEALQAGQS